MIEQRIPSTLMNSKSEWSKNKLIRQTTTQQNVWVCILLTPVPGGPGVIECTLRWQQSQQIPPQQYCIIQVSSQGAGVDNDSSPRRLKSQKTHPYIDICKLKLKFIQVNTASPSKMSYFKIHVGWNIHLVYKLQAYESIQYHIGWSIHDSTYETWWSDTNTKLGWS